MNTIDPNKPIQTVVDSKKGRAQDNKQATSSFDAVFRQHFAEGEIKPSGPESLTLASGVHPAQFGSESKPLVSTVVDTIAQLVETMTAYRDRLADTKVTLKEIAPLVQQMESQSKALLATSGDSGVGDAHLQEAIDRSVMISTLEISKYRSGYYNG